jgi:hypothetical protein
MSACLSYFWLRPRVIDQLAAVFGVVVTTLMILAKVMPIVPGHFTIYEWIALVIWGGLGLLMRLGINRSADRSVENLAANAEETP